MSLDQFNDFFFKFQILALQFMFLHDVFIVLGYENALWPPAEIIVSVNQL